MTEWRLFRGWSEAELTRRLDELEPLRRNFSESDPMEMTAEAGWRHVRSEAVIARESPGPPEPGGAYQRARRAVTDFRFSDPRIVEAHFDPDSPLAGRRMLLELEALGVRYLCGTVVAAVENGDGDGRTTFGYRYDTLEGHIERGIEWFRLIKDHASGEVRFSIDARWKPGDFPNAWSRLGFSVLGPIHQEMWHRRAHWRLHHLAGGTLQGRRGRRLRHEGPHVTLGGTRAQEPLDRWGAFAAAAGLGAMTGVRSTSAVALLAAVRGLTGRAAGPGLADRLLHRPEAALLLPLAAAGEAVADKLPAMPPRTDWAPLAGRAVLACAAGAALAQRHGRPPLAPALLAAATAVGSAVAATRSRAAVGARLPVPDFVLGLLEDASVAAAALALWRRVG